MASLLNDNKKFKDQPIWIQILEVFFILCMWAIFLLALSFVIASIVWGK